MTDAISFEITDENTEKAYRKMRREHTLRDYNERMLANTAEALSAHESFANVEFDEDNVAGTLREKEAIAVMTVVDKLWRDRKEMSRLDHLKAAVTGR